MSAVFLPETVVVLNRVKASPLLFSNMIAAEIFDAKYTLGERKIYPRTDGKYAVVDLRRAVGDRTESVHDTLDEADKALMAAPEEKPK